MEGTLSDPIVVRVAYWVAVSTLLLAVVLLTTILLLRIRTQRREQRDAQAMQYWTQILRQELETPGVVVRGLERGEVAGFLEAWNAVHEPLDESASRRLIPVGTRVGLADAARKLLRRGYHDRAMAIIAMGHLRDPRLFDDIAPHLRDRSPIVSLCAGRALAQIDSPRAMTIFVPLILEREDWAPGSVARILAENSDGSAGRELSKSLLRANADTTVKLVRFLADIDPARAAEVIHQLMGSEVDDRLLSVCLQLVNDRRELGRVRKLLHATRWHVRMHAASALARIGEAADHMNLEPLLSDSVWWVRYRAAQAMLMLPGMDSGKLLAIRERTSDAYGRGIIDHVLAEQNLRAAV